MAHSLKKIWNIASGILVALVVALALLLVGARVLGLQVFTVLSGSMEPTYHTGSLIYVKSIDTGDIQSGTVITFMLDEDTIATHRVVAVVPDEEDPSVVRFRTKGDANEAEDGSLVHYKNVIGTPVFTIPGLGYLADYIQNPPGTYVAISAGALLLIAVFLPDIFASDKEEDKEKKEKKDKKKKKALSFRGSEATEESFVSNTSTVGNDDVTPATSLDAPKPSPRVEGGPLAVDEVSNTAAVAEKEPTTPHQSASLPASPRGEASPPASHPNPDLASRLMATSDGLLNAKEIDILVQRLSIRPLDESEIAAIQSLLKRRRAQRGQN